MDERRLQCRRILAPVKTQPFAIAPSDRDVRCEQARRDGYLYLPRLVSPEALAPLRALVERALVTRGWIEAASEPLSGATDPALKLGRSDDARWFGFLADVLHTEAYRSVAARPELVDVVRDVAGADVEMHVGDVCRLVSPGDPALTTPPHQDAAYVKEPQGVWTAWMALVPCPLEVGPLALWPGSNHGGLRDHADGRTVAPEDVVWATGDLAVGDVVLFSSLTVHRALDNVSGNRLRVSVDHRYRPRTSPA